MQSKKIKEIQARTILDSRGNPTIEADVLLYNGSMGRAAVPSGASTGEHEAIELRDNNKTFYCGKSVNQGIENIHNIIKPLLLNHNINDIAQIDTLMLNADGSQNKQKLGANSILAVSLACLRAAASHENLPLYQYINKLYPNKLSMPTPMMNILNGGSHADNLLDIQEFMIFPIGLKNFSDSLRAGVEIFHNLKKILKRNKHNTNIGDEGGFAPNLSNNEQAIELILEAIVQAGYQPGKEITITLDVAASELYNHNTKKYHLSSEKKSLSSYQLIDYYVELCSKYPIVSIEDGLQENDWKGWSKLNRVLGQKIQIVGDDLTVTQHTRLEHAIQLNAINAILIKLNQVGSFTETMQTIHLAQKNNLGFIISHRSGETEDTIIADLSVATGCGQIKTGSLCRTDRTSKYNQLIRIEEQIRSHNQKNQFKYLYDFKKTQQKK